MTASTANYEKALAWLYSTQGIGIKLGLENIHRLLNELGVRRSLAERRPRIFHVAGTNGKGSVCAMIDAMLRAAGFRTGLFTSPHLISFRERIRLNGEEIPEAEAAAGLNRIREIVAGWEFQPTFFEIATALGLAWFIERDAEAIVLETGLGGRLDSTNAVIPSVTVITPIGMDHWQYLGNTIAEIAAEKAGIFKPGVPVVSSPQLPEAARVLTANAESVGAALKWICEPVPWEVALAGTHQKLNAALAVAALAAANLPVSEEAIRAGLKNVSWPGRFQRVTAAGAEIILDGAHNAPAAARLLLTWREVFGTQTPVLLLGMLRDKDVAAVFRELAPLAETVVIAAVPSPRSCTVGELADVARETMPSVRCVPAESAEAALVIAQREACRLGKPVLVAGSLFLVGRVLALLSGTMQEESAQ